MSQQVFARRVTGVETEYGITCVHDGGGKRLPAEEIARYMFRPVVDTWSSSNVFLENGARLYLDVGSHPEVATAECDTLAGLIAQERAGDRIVNDLAAKAEAKLANESIGGRVYLLKNNLDSFGNSYGCHENYLVGRSAVLKTLGQQLLPFLITRQLICGAGSIQDGRFQISQRADHVWEGVSSATTRSRPIINTRDEPHADSHRFRRLHVIVGDSNMSETSMALKVGATQLVLEMIEAGIALPVQALAQEMQAIRDISRDTTGAVAVQLSDGSQLSALAIQRRYCHAAHDWLEQRPDEGTPTEQMRKVVALWAKVLDAIEAGDLDAISTEVDWAIKLKLLRQFQQRLGLEPEDFSHPKLQQIDLAYHDIRPGRGLFLALEAKGALARWIDDAAIERAMTTPPSTTRAALRGAFLSQAQELSAPVACDWLRLKVLRPEPQIVELSDPLQAHSDQVASLLEYMRTHHGSKAEDGSQAH
ncbi:Pup--protein ligase [Corynebacterium pseudopelargi]|uniref:Pup--protein ligase n=1 Tax=Corynebacterium pseudopelargi TaxID=2080757 RepID=A0A3G6IUC0_9CORY|nr:Pup--protein ligase [Corynebacterium pseudopelargi]AZA09276.1 Pup--protein ligase [Corynebacterium pseudopelargi]